MELIVVIVMIGILSGIVINARPWYENPLKNSQDRLQSVVKTARTRAMNTTSTYRINADPNNPNEAIQVQKIRSGSCQANATLRQASLATDTTIALNSVAGFAIGDRVSVGGTQADVLSVNFGDNTLTLGGTVGEKAAGTKVETVKNWRNDGVFLAEDLNINKKSAKTDPDVRLAGKFGGTTVTGWSICINSRGLVTLFNADGIVNNSLDLVLTNTRTNEEAKVTIAPGGAMGN
jgi:Tfp pilus assembly protein FimT